ncbi:MAG: DMT family transporter [Anaerolineales bacterium]|nr:DMT family transporter [Anaerolineales bacterium]
MRDLAAAGGDDDPILLFPASADFRHLPGLKEWSLYLGGALGVAILAAPIFPVPRIGTIATMLSKVPAILVWAADRPFRTACLAQNRD